MYETKIIELLEEILKEIKKPNMVIVNPPTVYTSPGFEPGVWYCNTAGDVVVRHVN